MPTVPNIFERLRVAPRSNNARGPDNATFELNNATRVSRELPLLSPKIRHHLTTDEPDQDGEDQEGHSEPKMDHQSEQQQQAELIGFAEVDRQAGVQGIMDRFDMACVDADGFGWSERQQRLAQHDQCAFQIGMPAAGETDPDASDASRKSPEL